MSRITWSGACFGWLVLATAAGCTTPDPRVGGRVAETIRYDVTGDGLAAARLEEPLRAAARASAKLDGVLRGMWEGIEGAPLEVQVVELDAEEPPIGRGAGGSGFRADGSALRCQLRVAVGRAAGGMPSHARLEVRVDYSVPRSQMLAAEVAARLILERTISGFVSELGRLAAERPIALRLRDYGHTPKALLPDTVGGARPSGDASTPGAR